MEVLKSNFVATLPRIEEAINSSDWVTFDTELTGIELNKNTRLNALDDAETRYGKVRAVATAFRVIQLGLATFKWDMAVKKYHVHVFTIYVFQRSFDKRWPDERFTCQASSLEFLAAHNMDFNKVFRDGVSYLTRDQETQLRARLGPHEPRADIALGDHQQFIDDTFAKIDEWLQNGRENELWLSPVNAFMRRLQYQELEKRYATGLMWESKDNEAGRKCLVVRRVTVEAKAQHEQAAAVRGAEKVDEAVGMRKVLDLLIAAKKPVAGHNMLLDLCILYQQFLEPLPPALADFKQTVMRDFPRVFDTKHVASAAVDFKGLIDSTALGDLYERMQAAPFNDVDFVHGEGCEGFAAGGQHHDSGWDAYMTGVCLARMASVLRGFDDMAVKVLSNKLHLMRCDLPYLNLVGDEPEPDRVGTFHVSGFPEDWKTSHIVEAFSSVGSVQVRWIDDTSCLVVVADPDLRDRVVPHFDAMDPKPFVLLPYDVYSARRAEQQRGLATPTPHKRQRTD